MQAYLDNQAIAFEAGADQTLAAVIHQGRQEAAKGDRVIVGVQCDGLELAPEDMDAKFAEPADTFERVDLRSARAEQVVVNALRGASSLLADADRRREEVADLFTRGETTDGTVGLAECLNAWGQVHQAIAQSLLFLDLDTEAITVQGQPLEETIGEIREQLEQVKEVLQANDYVLLADLLRYEFGSATERWQAAIDAVLARAEAPAA